MATNIILADAQATPVNHTFIPLGKDDKGVYWFEDQSAPSPIGFPRIGVSYKRPAPSTVGTKSDSSRIYRITLTVTVPVLETLSNNSSGITPPPTVAYVTRSTHEFLHPERSNLVERKTARKFSELLLKEPQIVALVETLVPLQ